MAWLKPLSVRAVRTPAVPAILPTFSANLPDQLERLASGILLGGLCLIPAFLGLGLHEPFEFGKFFLLSLLALILVALQGAAILIRGRGVSLRPLLALEWSVLGLVCTSALSAFFSLSPSSSWGWSHQSCIGWWAIVSLMVLVFSVRNLFATPSRQRQLFMAMALSGLVPALYGVLQWLRLDPWEWSQMTLMSGEQRIFGTLGHPNHLGAFLVVLLPWVVHQSRTASTDYGRSLWVSVGLLYSMAIVGTYSRIAWVGLAMVILGTLTLIISRYRVLTGAVSLGVMLFLVMTIPSLRERALGVVQFESRQEIWSAAVQISRDYPITGCGLHSFGSAFGVYRSAAFEVNEWNVTPFHAHNELLHLFATQGLLGGMMGLILIGATILSLRSSSCSGVLSASLGLLGLMLSTGFLVIPLLLLFGILLGLVLATQHASELKLTRPIPAKLGLVLLVVLALVTGAFGRQIVIEAECSWTIQRALSLSPTDRDESRYLLNQVCLKKPSASVYWTLKAGFLTRELPLLSTREQTEWLLEAREAMRRVTELEPHNGDAWAGYARLLSLSLPAKEREIEPAKEAYLVALKWEPNQPRLRFEFASRAFEWNDLQLAREQIEIGRRFAPDFARLTALESLILWKEGRQLEAIPFAEKALTQRWYDSVLFQDWYARYGWMVFELKQFIKAELIGKEISKLWPRHANGYLLQAAAREQLERPTEAISLYREVLSLDPTNRYALMGISRLQGKR